MSQRDAVITTAARHVRSEGVTRLSLERQNVLIPLLFANHTSAPGSVGSFDNFSKC